MQQLRFDLKDNIDVSIYAKPEYNVLQMNEIKKGLQANLNVSIYAKPKYSWMEMEEIRLELLEESTLF